MISNNINNNPKASTIMALSPALLLSSSVNTSSPVWSFILQHWILVFAAIVIIGVLFSLWNLLSAIFYDKERSLLASRGITIEDTSFLDSRESIWDTFNKKAWDIVPIENENDIALEHDFDGIVELDNRLPPWWLYMFYGCIVWAAAYWYIYEVSDIGQSQNMEYNESMAIAEKRQKEYLAQMANTVNETNVVALTDELNITGGQSLYTSNCVPCHGPQGQGGIGPNLTDEYWIHGNSIKDIFKTIKYGVPEKGMIAWNTSMNPASIQKLSSYILTLKGTNPPNPKAPQGDKMD